MEKFNFNSFQTALQTKCITQQEIFFSSLGKHYNKDIWNNRIGNSSNNGKSYDIYEFDNPTIQGKEKIFFETSYYYGKGSLLINPKRLNFPINHFNKKISVREMFGDKFVNEAFPDISISDKNKLSNVQLYFEYVPSNIVSNLIAIYNKEENVIEVFPFREYHKMGFPILFGYHFYILFIIHHLTHFLNNHDVKKTEVIETKESKLLKIGEDCISFTPLIDTTLVNDFVNYLFWTHQPKAFENEAEQKAFKRMSKFAFNGNLFSKDELLNSISDSKAGENTRKILDDVLMNF